MARQSINVNPGLKEFEAYMDFSGGLNTETSNERLSDNEFVQMQNVDLNTRGSVKKRTGRVNIPITYATGTVVPTGNTQGMFFFYRQNESKPDVLFAANGRLYVKRWNSNVVTGLTISGLKNPTTGVATSTFQTTRDIEAVQYYDQLYVATGFDLVKVTYDGTNFIAAAVAPYEPNANELKFIGSNALLGYAMQNKTDTTLTGMSEFYVRGMTFSDNNKLILAGQVDNAFNISGYVVENVATIPAGWTYTKTYQLYYRKQGFDFTETTTIPATAGQTVFNLPSNSTYDPNTNSIQVFSASGTPVVTTELLSGGGFTETDGTKITLTTGAAAGTKITLKWIVNWRKGNSKIATMSNFAVVSGNSVNPATFRALEKGGYDFKVEVLFKRVEDADTTNIQQYLQEYVFEGFQVKAMQEDGDILEQKIEGVKQCNRIRLYWNRLMMFGDPAEPTQLYFSDLDNPAYFPQVNTLRFDTGKQEPITTVVRLNDYLTVFSKSVIHVLVGKSPSQFSINLINDTIGCAAPKSAVVTGNVVTFLSQEGVYILKPSAFRLDQLNVQRADAKIKDEMLQNTNAVALSYDAQYWLCFPTQAIMYRYYYEQGVWVKDVSNKLNITHFLQNGEDVFNLTADVKLYQHDTSVYTDAGIVYDMIVESKYFDLSKSFNFKKLRRLYVLGRCYDLYDVDFYTSVYADNTIVLDPESGAATVTPEGIATWVVTLTPNLTFEHGTTFGFPTGSPPVYTPATTWELGFDELGHRYLSVKKSRIRGKCRRVKLLFVNSQDKEVELFGFGLEFKLKKP
ncbi:hypothetical protein UFOVP451_62 [uncultured Caudovirales phage]|uniref:Uncharacterized protein n=1 Tax=uncultured Caudovirales phage TaxID=2100421 RepID=A0A6J5M8C7_9CAUD|nr:hypothetical protein UFOVP451_62 [uncultured Caudovirales phage]